MAWDAAYRDKEMDSDTYLCVATGVAFKKKWCLVTQQNRRWNKIRISLPVIPVNENLKLFN